MFLRCSISFTVRPLTSSGPASVSAAISIPAFSASPQLRLLGIAPLNDRQPAARSPHLRGQSLYSYYCQGRRCGTSFPHTHLSQSGHVRVPLIFRRPILISSSSQLLPERVRRISTVSSRKRQLKSLLLLAANQFRQFHNAKMLGRYFFILCIIWSRSLLQWLCKFVDNSGK